jgi:hypothetical protein
MKRATDRTRPGLGPLSSLTVAALLVAGALAGTTAVAGADGAGTAERPNITPGQWETTVVLEMEGMPARPPITSTQCIKPDDIKNVQAFAGSVQKRGGKCTFGDFKFSGAKLSYTFSCEHGATGETEVSFAGTSYEATTKLSSPGRGSGPIKMTHHISSKRIGDC